MVAGLRKADVAPRGTHATAHNAMHMRSKDLKQ